MSRPRLTLATCMSPNMAGAAEALASWLSQHTRLQVEFVRHGSWQSRQAAFDRAELDLLWICGLPYVERADRSAGDIVPLAAPVMLAERYRRQPVYYSEVLVPNQSEVRSLADLPGTTWGYNEPGSHSGYGVMAAHLARSGLDWQYFGQVVETGSHLASMAALRRGEIEASAVDSTVWETALRAEPGLFGTLRSILTLGPSPAPPLITRRVIADAYGDMILQALAAMPTEEAGRRILAGDGLGFWAPVEDRDYDPIRQMAAEAARLRPPWQVPA